MGKRMRSWLARARSSKAAISIEYALIIFVVLVLCGVLLATGKPMFEQIVKLILQQVLQMVK